MKKYRLVSIIIAAALTLTALCSCGRTIDGEQVTSATEAADSPPVREAYPVSFDSETFESSPASVASLSPRPDRDTLRARSCRQDSGRKLLLRKAAGGYPGNRKPRFSRHRRDN